VENVKLECFEMELTETDEPVFVTNKTYKCEHCPRTFARDSALKAHSDRLHANAKETKKPQIQIKSSNSNLFEIQDSQSNPNIGQNFRPTILSRIPRLPRILNRFSEHQQKLTNNPTLFVIQNPQNRPSVVRAVPKPFYHQNFQNSNQNHKSTNRRVLMRDLPLTQNNKSKITEKQRPPYCQFCYDGQARGNANPLIACGHCKDSKPVIKTEPKEPAPPLLCSNIKVESVDTSKNVGRGDDQDLILGL